MTVTRTTDAHAGHEQFHSALGTFHMPLTERLSPEPEAYFCSSLEASDRLATEIKRVQNDGDLSEAGRTKRLDPMRELAVRSVARTWSAIAEFERRIDVVENNLCVVPALEETHSAAASIDREIREWWRAKSDMARISLIQGLDDSKESRRIQIALMRSPIALLDAEAKVVRERWADAQRKLYPDTAARIDLGRSSIEWTRRGVANLAGLTMVSVGWDGRKILRTVLTDTENSYVSDGLPHGYGAWGITESTATQEMLLLTARKAA